MKTNKQIRDYIEKRDGVKKVKITRNGEIHCYGSMPRGDGGNPYWWMFVGMKNQIEEEIEGLN